MVGRGGGAASCDRCSPFSSEMHMPETGKGATRADLSLGQTPCTRWSGVESTVTNRRGDGYPCAGPEQGEMAMYCSPGMTATS